MKSSKKLFTKEQINNIEVAIGEAETATSAEVVPVIATVSGRYDRAEDIFAFVFSLLVLGCTWFFLQNITETSVVWNQSIELSLNLPIVLGILVATFFIGIVLANRLPFLKLIFVSKQEMQEEVERRAHERFQRLKIRKTENATGLLIYVSLYEHMVHVVGDDTITSKLSESDWSELCDIIVDGFKDGKAEEAMKNGIKHCGELLAKHFPFEAGDKNELVNTLHLLD